MIYIAPKLIKVIIDLFFTISWYFKWAKNLELHVCPQTIEVTTIPAYRNPYESASVVFGRFFRFTLWHVRCLRKEAIFLNVRFWHDPAYLKSFALEISSLCRLNISATNLCHPALDPMR